MSLYEVLGSVEPIRAPKLHRSTKNLKGLYEIVAERYAEIERAIFGGYSWMQVSGALETDCAAGGVAVQGIGRVSAVRSARITDRHYPWTEGLWVWWKTRMGLN